MANCRKGFSDCVIVFVVSEKNPIEDTSTLKLLEAAASTTVFLTTDQSNPVSNEIHIRLTNLIQDKHTTLVIVNATIMNTVLTIQNSAVIVENSTFHNSSLQLQSNTQCLSLSISKSTFNSALQTQLPNVSAEIFQLSGMWSLILINCSSFQSEYFRNSSAITTANAMVTKLMVQSSQFRNLHDAIFMRKNDTTDLLLIFSSQFVQNVQVFNLFQADIKQVSVEQSIIGISPPLPSFQVETAPYCSFILNVTFSSVFLLNNTFHHNKVSVQAGNAGLINIDKSDIIVHGCCFEQNVVATGSLLVAHNSSITVSKCNFTNNVGHTGCVLKAFASIMQISDSYFKKNKAVLFGGTVALFHASSARFISSVFLGNVAVKGGVLFLRNYSQATFISVTFENNTAFSASQAVALSSWSSVLAKLADSCTLNEAGGYGGVVYAQDNAKISLTQCEIVANKAAGGGALFVKNNADVSVQSSLLSDNSAFDCNVSQMPQQQTDENMTKSMCGGGNIYICQNVTVTIDNCIVTNNQADMGGVAFATNTVFSHSEQTHRNHSQVTQVPSTVLMITNSIFENNRAATGIGEGGVVWAAGHVSLTVHSSFFSLNHATRLGGVLKLIDDCDAKIVNSTFVNNSRTSEGGVVWTSGNIHLSVVSCLFSLNTAQYGGVLLATNHPDVKITNSTFTNNSASAYGGVYLVAHFACLTLFSSAFTHNSATQYGGVLFTTKDTLVIITSSSFVNSSSSLQGGVLVAGFNASLTIVSSTFRFSTSKEGAVIFSAHNVQINVSGTNFSQNVASQQGAAVSCTQCVITVLRSHFHRNEGTALLVLETPNQVDKIRGISSLTDCLFTNNIQKNSTHGSDMSFSVPLLLQNISVKIYHREQNLHSITCTQETIVTSLVIVIKSGMTAAVASFSQIFGNQAPQPLSLCNVLSIQNQPVIQEC